jgi:hypothetical protein
MLGVNIVAARDRRGGALPRLVRPPVVCELRAGRPITLPPPSKEWERDPGRSHRCPNQTRVSFVGRRHDQRQMDEFVARPGPTS